MTAPIARANYDVQIDLDPNATRADNALIEVEDADGATTQFRRDMTAENVGDATAFNVTWKSLGVFTMDDTAEVRFIRDATAGGYIVADGIRLVFDSPTSTPPRPRWSPTTPPPRPV